MIQYNTDRNVKLIIPLTLMIVFFLASAIPADAQVTSINDVTLTQAGTPSEQYNAVQLPAEVGQPVRWVKQVDVQNLYDNAVSQLLVAIPQEASNVAVTDTSNNIQMQVQISDGEITITDELDFMETRSYLIKYSTESPDKQETILIRDGDSLKKSVTVSSDMHYEDVLTYTDIPEMNPSEVSSKIKLYWDLGGVKKDMTKDPGFDLKFYDTNGDGKYDRMSWIAPHLSTQIFEVVIFSDVDPGTYANIGLTLLYPADGEYITSTSRIGFNYSVQYNSSTTVLCNLTVDGTVKRANIPTLVDSEITTYFNISSGTHTWNVNCAGNDGTTNTSPTSSFIVDLDNPVITLNTPDYHVSTTDSIDLNFTAVDTKYPVLICSLSVNGALETSSLVVTNNTRHVYSMSGMTNGVYDWNVSCKDAAGNIGSSEEKVFYISAGTPSEFNITPNKKNYRMGESGYMMIEARAGSNLTLFIDPPLHDSTFRYFTGSTYPLIEMINFTDNAGTYNIDGIFSEGGNLYIVKTSFEVTNGFNAYIDVNATDGEPGTTFNFEANATGGIGPVTYTWDFDDGSTIVPSTNGVGVDHTFSTVGEYIVKLTATDSKSNIATDTQKINIYDQHVLTIIVKELQTGKLLQDVKVEVNDQRKDTDAEGKSVFEIYEGKTRIYIGQEGYEWYKKIMNITGDQTLTVELNNTAITNYTPKTEEEKAATEQAGTVMESAEELLARISAAIENIATTDKATKDALEALEVEPNLQKAKKRIRQMIRDLGNAETSKDMDEETKQQLLDNNEKELATFDTLLTQVEVQDTAEFVDYPKSSDIDMLSVEYLRFKGLEYSKGQKEDYIEANTQLQTDITITTRLSVITLTTLDGQERTAGLVINKITKSPVDTDDMKLIEYLPKEVAKSASDITKITEFQIIKDDPILGFAADLSSYAYYIVGEASIEDLKKTKHVILHEPTEGGVKGLPGVTGFSILPSLKIENPKMAAQIALIIILLIAYLVYHFELIDRYKDWKTKNNPQKAAYQTDTAYRPESTFDSLVNKIKTFVAQEDQAIHHELAHIKSLVVSAYRHAESSDHEKAHETYAHIMGAYKLLSPEAKSQIHPHTKEVYNRVLVTKINNMINEANLHLQNSNANKAQTHYSEIKKLYTQLEKTHRPAVSDRCIKLHQKLFENSLH